MVCPKRSARANRDQMLYFLLLQGVIDEYGIDWSEPAPLEDEQTVTVDNLPNILSDEERATLRQQLTHSDTLTEEWMVHSFTVAKVFVHAAIEDQAVPGPIKS